MRLSLSFVTGIPFEFLQVYRQKCRFGPALPVVSGVHLMNETASLYAHETMIKSHCKNLIFGYVLFTQARTRTVRGSPLFGGEIQ